MNDNATIHRELKERNFVQVPNELLADEELSFRAKGILCYLLSKPDNWRAQVSDIYQHGKEGKLAIRTALKELRKLGYARLDKVQDRGRFAGSKLFISDYRRYVAGDETTQCLQGSAPRTKNPHPGNPHPENRSLSNTGFYQNEIIPITPAEPGGLEVAVRHEADEDAWPEGEPRRAVAVRPAVIEATVVPRSKPKAEKPPPNPDHSKLIGLWTEAYVAEFGCAYAFAGGRDARAVKTLLDTSKRTPEEIVELARRAWKESGYPFAGAASLHTFATGINLIASELHKRKNGTHTNGKVPAWQERKEWQDQLKRAEDEIKTLTSGDSHADLDFVDKATLKRAKAVRDEMRQKLGYKI